MRDWRCREDQQNSAQVSLSSWTTFAACHLIAWSESCTRMCFAPCPSTLIEVSWFALGKQNQCSTCSCPISCFQSIASDLFAHVWVWGGSTSPFVQTCIHAYADGHSSLSRWLSCPPTRPRANYSSAIRKRRVDIRQFHLQLSVIYQNLILLGNMTVARATKVRFVWWVAQRTFRTVCLSTGMTFGDSLCSMMLCQVDRIAGIFWPGLHNT